MVIRILMILSVAFLALAGGARADSLRLILPDTPPAAGEMIPVTVRGEYTSTITLEKLVFPNSDAYDWIQIARDQWRDESIGGRTVKVFERRVAVFPREPGQLSIGPVTHNLTVIGRTQPREPLDVTAEPVTLTVAPFPAESPPLSARRLTLEDRLSTDPAALRDGETLLRRIVIKAVGTLPHQLPTRPAMRQPWLITFVAPEVRKVDLRPEGPVTTIIWEWNLRPKTGEPGVLQGMEIPWFDTTTRQMRMAEIPALPFGYASFRDNQGGADRLAPEAIAKGLGALGAGLIVGLGVASAGMSARRRSDVVRALRRLSPFDPTRKALKEAARSGDLMRVRRSAARYLRRRADLGLPVTGGETAGLDETLYGRNPEATAMTPTQAVQQILKPIRHQS